MDEEKRGLQEDTIKSLQELLRQYLLYEEWSVGFDLDNNQYLLSDFPVFLRSSPSTIDTFLQGVKKG